MICTKTRERAYLRLKKGQNQTIRDDGVKKKDMTEP